MCMYRYVCIYVCMYVCMYMCLNVFVQTCMYIIHLDVYIYMCICFVYDVETIYVTSYEGVSDVWEDGHVHIDTHTQTCVYISIYVYYVYIYVYIYKYRFIARGPVATSGFHI